MELRNLIRNKSATEYDLFVYGAIIDGDKWEENEVNTASFLAAINEVSERGVTVLNIFINSPGGSVFAASAMVSMLKRLKEAGVTVNGYIDGICASAATYLLMACDSIKFYKNSTMMIHKPVGGVYGNAETMQKMIETLDGVEDNLIIPTYRDKTDKSVEEIKSMLAAETWFSGNPEDKFYIGAHWNAEDLEDAKQVTACMSPLLQNYKNLPERLRKAPGEEKKINYTQYERMIQEVKK